MVIPALLSLSACSSQNPSQDEVIESVEDSVEPAPEPEEITPADDYGGSENVAEDLDYPLSLCADAVYATGGPERTPEDLLEAVTVTVRELNRIGGEEVTPESFVTYVYNPFQEPYILYMFEEPDLYTPWFEGDPNPIALHEMLNGLARSMISTRDLAIETAYANIGAPNGFYFDQYEYDDDAASSDEYNVILNPDGLILAVCSKQGIINFGYRFGISEQRQQLFDDYDPDMWEVIEGDPPAIE